MLPRNRSQVAFCLGAVGRPQLGDAGRCGDTREDRTILAVAIADEIARPLPERRGLAQLLGDPGVRRVPCHANVHHAARAEGDHEAGVHGAEQQVGDREKVAGPDLRGVVAQEGGPRLTGLVGRARGVHVPLDGGLGDAEAQLQWPSRRSPRWGSTC